MTDNPKVPYEPTDEHRAMWSAWCNERPDEVRVIAEKFHPWHLYRLKTTGQVVQLHSWHEAEPPEWPHVTMTVHILPEHNPGRIMIVGKSVFGIKPDDLEEIVP